METMNKERTNGENFSNIKCDKENTSRATRFMCMPGIKPVIIPARIPRNIAENISASIDFFK